MLRSGGKGLNENGFVKHWPLIMLTLTLKLRGSVWSTAVLYSGNKWKVVSETGDEKQRSKNPTTSCSTGSGCHVCEVHTCFNHLLLPDYKSKEAAIWIDGGVAPLSRSVWGGGGVKVLHIERKIPSVVHSHPPSHYIRKPRLVDFWWCSLPTVCKTKLSAL